MSINNEERKYIGMFGGEPIHEMNREQLLEFAEWAGKRIEYLERKNTPNYQMYKVFPNSLDKISFYPGNIYPYPVFSVSAFNKFWKSFFKKK